MSQFLNTLFSWSITEDGRSQHHYTKSLLYLVLFVLLICNHFFNTIDTICTLLDPDFLYYVSSLILVGLDFFFTLTIVSFIISLISFLISAIWQNPRLFTYCKAISKISKGSELCSIKYLENLSLLLLTAFLFDINTSVLFMNRLNGDSSIILGIILVIISFIMMIAKILYFFYYSSFPHYSQKEKIILEQLIKMTTENQKLKDEIEKLKFNDYKNIF